MDRWVGAAAAGALCLVSGPPALAQGSGGMSSRRQLRGGHAKEIVFDAATNLLYATCDFNDPGGLTAKGAPVRSAQGFDVSRMRRQ